ncbi:MAG: DeoR/GlpR family DNA-binding transcription regulator [Actinobacteria bacterium]|nr:DeoR/GlpR family DNA-binding transcription regulator [Actinomycetota bacterium]
MITFVATAYTTSTVARFGGPGKRSRRMADLLDFVSDRGEASIGELSAHFHTSAATIRRDLGLLADQGLLLRTHGGARMSGAPAEVPVSLRDTRFQAAKDRIAKAAAAMIPKERHSVAFSGGTTSACVARELAWHTDLTVITNSLTTATLLTRYPRLKVVMTGGILRPQSLELVGVLAEGTFNAVTRIGTAILGADGVSAAEGVTTYDETEARTNHAMVAKADRTIVVADGSKIGRAAFATMAVVSEIDVIVTDASADEAELARLRRVGVQVVVA